MQAQGDDLSKPRDIDFYFVFATEQKATAFSKQERETTGFKTKISRYEERKMWQATITKFMIPTYNDITTLEKSLTHQAAALEGEADGWGCFQVDKNK